MTKFEIGKTYKGVSGAGESAITIVKRTEKSVWVKGCFESEGESKRLKIRSYHNNHESLIYHSWMATADKCYSEEEQTKDLLDAMYYR
jgi:hypothetical protein